jgi:hypothetical protein
VARLEIGLATVLPNLGKWYVKALAGLVVSLSVGGMLGVRALAETLPGGARLKHRVKSVWRFLRNGKVEYRACCADLFTWVAARMPQVLVAVDWTSFHDKKTLVASVITAHGRAIPVYYEICDHVILKRSQNAYELAFLTVLKTITPPETEVVLVMDRGFDRTALKKQLAGLFRYVIRQRAKIKVKSESYTGLLKNRKTRRGTPVDMGRCVFKHYEPRNAVECRVVCFRGWNQKERWVLTTDLWDAPARRIVDIYALRFRIEESFRDIKNKRWGWKLRFTRLSSSDRYLRMLLIAAVTMAVTLLIGLQGERRGYDMDDKANTEKGRTHSLVRLGAAMLDHRPQASDRRPVHFWRPKSRPAQRTYGATRRLSS